MSLIQHDGFIAGDFRQRFIAHWDRAVQFFQFLGIKPDPATTALTDVQRDCGDLDFGQWAGTGGAVHDPSVLDLIPSSQRRLPRFWDANRSNLPANSLLSVGTLLLLCAPFYES